MNADIRGVPDLPAIHVEANRLFKLWCGDEEVHTVPGVALQQTALQIASHNLLCTQFRLGSEWAILRHQLDNEDTDSAFVNAWVAQDSAFTELDMKYAVTRIHKLQSPTPSPTDEEWFKQLPDEFRIYQGCGQSFGCDRSWTTDIFTAQDFAKRFGSAEAASGVVVRRVIRKSDVLLATVSRGEFEIVPNDWDRYYRKPAAPDWTTRQTETQPDPGFVWRLFATTMQPAVLGRVVASIRETAKGGNPWN